MFMQVLLVGVPLPHPEPIAQALRAHGDAADIAAGCAIELTRGEFAALRYLVPHRGGMVSPDAINTPLYDIKQGTPSNVVEVYIHRLRGKIDAGAAQPLILTRWGQGYLLRGESG